MFDNIDKAGRVIKPMNDREKETAPSAAPFEHA
jgi:hypothetical protein